MCDESKLALKMPLKLIYKVAYEYNNYKANFFYSKKYGPLRELNPGPPAPEAGIMPLDQVATVIGLSINPSYELSATK